MKVLSKYKYSCDYYVDCFMERDSETGDLYTDYDRGLRIFWDDDRISEDAMYQIVDDLYGQWFDDEHYPDASCWCLEEWILRGLTGTGLIFDYEYLGKHKGAIVS